MEDTDVNALQQRWAAEKKLLIDDCTAARTEASDVSATLAGWETLVRDILFYGGLHGRAAALTSRFAEQLRGSLGEVEGVQEVEVTELHLPASSEYAPTIKLLKYHGPELSEWAVTWEPPSAQASGSITLRGRKFGVSFSIVVAIGSLRLRGTLQCKWCPDEAPPTLAAGFKRMPDLAFDISLAGKALSLGSETLRSWLQRQIERTIREKAVLPKAVHVQLPPLHHLFGKDGRDAAGGPSSEPDEPPYSAEDAAMDAALQALLALRVDSHAGPCWELDARLAEALGASLDVLQASQPPIVAGDSAGWQWGTTLVLALLQLRFHDRANAWSALVEVRRNAISTELMRHGMEVVCGLNLTGVGVAV